MAALLVLAFLAVPVAAMLLALLDTYAKRYELLPEMLAKQAQVYERGTGTRRRNRRNHEVAAVDEES